MYLKLIRTTYTKELTLGTMFLYDDFETGLCFVETLELPWNNNQKNISCILNGEYNVKRRSSKKHKDHLHITGVHNRSWILIHAANFVKELRGCIAPGITYDDINGNGVIDVTKSNDALQKLLKHIPKNKNIKIEIV